MAVLDSPDDRLAVPYSVGPYDVIDDMEARLRTALAEVRAGAPASGLTLLWHGRGLCERRWQRLPVACDGEGTLADVDDEAMRREPEWLRNASYDARLGDEIREAMNPVAAVISDIPSERVDPSRVLAAIRRHARQDDDPPGWRLPQRIEPDQIPDYMTHRDPLRRRERNPLACPIPGFRAWLIQREEPLSRDSDTGISRLTGQTELPVPVAPVMASIRSVPNGTCRQSDIVVLHERPASPRRNLRLTRNTR